MTKGQPIPRRLPATFLALRHRNFRLFFAGQLVSLMGTWMQSVAQGWLVLQLTNSAFMLGLVGAASSLPILAFSFLGGTLADRVSKRGVLIATQSAAMLLALALWGLVASHAVQTFHVLIVATLLGVVMAFDIPARQAFVVEMVGKEDLINAIALNSSAFNTARIIGPAAAGVLIASAGTANCFLINGLSFVAVIAALAAMDVGLLNGPATSQSAGLRESLNEVKLFLMGSRVHLLVLLLTAALSVFVLPYAVLMPLFARDVLRVGVRGLGVLMSASGLGALTGALTVATFGGRGSRFRWLLGSSLLMAAALLGFSFSRTYVISLGLLFFVGLGVVIQATTANGFLQLSVPDGMRGRMMALFGIVFMGVMPLGNLLAGFLAEIFGVPLALALGAVLSAAVTGALYVLVPAALRP
ncbi:MAG: MFS transporter [Pseudomonadota bacterium]